MIYEPIIKAHQKKFVESFDLKKYSDSEAFGKRPKTNLVI